MDYSSDSCPICRRDCYSRKSLTIHYFTEYVCRGNCGIYGMGSDLANVIQKSNEIEKNKLIAPIMFIINSRKENNLSDLKPYPLFHLSDYWGEVEGFKLVYIPNK